MHITLKIALAIPAILFAFIGANWLLDPATAAQSLGMPLLEGAGLSTQIGDLASFFIAVSSFMLLGLFSQNKPWFYRAAILLFGNAVFRTVAWGVHGASFETASIAIEVIVGALLLFAANKVSSHAG